jgi:hypothetical protein
MTDFLVTALTFPTLIYSILLALCVVYWALAAFGLFDADVVDGLFDGDTDGADAPDVAGILAKLGMAGVPMMLVLTVLVFFAWAATYFVHLLVLQHLPNVLRYLAGGVVAVFALVPGLLVASLVLRPLRRFLVRLRPPMAPSILGRTAIVSTPAVSSDYGMATVDDGGAGLILQVRHADPERFKRGDRVVLVEFLEGQHAYRVVSEQQFQNP